MGCVMTMAARVIGVAVGAMGGALVVAVPSAASPPTPSPTVDQKQALFIQYLTDHGVPFTSKPRAISLAQSTCTILGSGSATRLQDAAAAIQNNISMRPEQVQQFAGAATAVFCPSVKIA
jgi:hypothetical protein